MNPAFRKGGPSPNPKGRPVKADSLANAVRTIVDPFRLARRVYELALNRAVDERGNVDERTPLGVSDTASMAAANWIRDTGWKPVQRVEIAGVAAPEDPLTPAERAYMARLLAEEERAAREAEEAGGGLQ